MIESYLERLFTWDSLENTERGVEFELKNRLVETVFTGLTTVRFDGGDVPLGDVTLELGDGTTVLPDEVTEEDPLEFDLADTMRVVADAERLTLGDHEVSMGFVVEGYGRVSFTTEDEVTEEDLVDVGIGTLDEDEAVGLVGEIREPVTLRRMLEEERSGEARDEVVDAVEDRLDEMRYVEERREIVDEGTRVDEAVEDHLLRLFDGRKRLAVYAALRSIGGGSVEDVAAEAGLEPASVEGTLKGMEMDGAAEYGYEDGEYRAVAPSELVREGADGIVEALKRALR